MSLFTSCALIGAGRSNLALASYLSCRGVKVTLRDAKNVSLPTGLSGDPHVSLICGKNYLDGLCEEIIFLSPSVRRDTRQIAKAHENGALISSETELFFLLCPAPVIAVTGSDGKTTVSTLTAKMLEAAGKRVHLIGNIGTPAISVLDGVREDDACVCELSSFQLMNFTPACRASVITCITENHLDWHRDMAEYVGAKMKIYENSKRRVVNADDVRLENIRLSGCVYFSQKRTAKEMASRYPGQDFACVEYGYAVLYEKGTHVRLFSLDDMKMRGAYNVANAMAAALLVYPDVKEKAIEKTVSSFVGVKHRCSFLGTYCGRRVYESSIDTTPKRTEATLSAFDGKCTVICGGRGKNLSLSPLAHALREKASLCVLVGENRYEILDALMACGYPKNRICVCDGFDYAVRYALENTEKGGTVLLSPASTSFDIFENYEARAKRFADAVKRYEDKNDKKHKGR